MTPASFEYLAPSSMKELEVILEKHGEEVKLLAGGQSLIPLMKLRFASFPYLADLSRINELRSMETGKTEVKLGPMLTVAEVERSDFIRNRIPLLHDACTQIADPLVRNMGTVGGNICHADPGNDLPAVMMALNATFIVRSGRGERSIPARSFFTDTFETALGKGEFLRSISIPLSSSTEGGAYIKHRRRAGDYSVAAAAVQLKVEDEAITEGAIALTSSGPKALFAGSASEALKGKKLTREVISSAASAAAREAMPSSDFYGSEDYKRKVIELCVGEALSKASSRIRGERR